MNATRGNIETIKTFISKIQDVNTTNAKGYSALTLAVENGSSKMVEFLLSNGAKANIIDAKGNNLAYYLIQSYKAGSNNFDDFTEKQNLLKNAGLDITVPQKDGNTLYHLAVAKNDLNILKKLESFDIDINSKNEEGMTALHKAALLAKDDSILKYLISRKANKEIKTEFDETTYDLAKENESLIENNVSVEFLK